MKTHVKKQKRKIHDGANEGLGKSNKISARDDEEMRDGTNEDSHSPSEKRAKKGHRRTQSSLSAIKVPRVAISKDEQVEWLTSSYKSHCGASELECDALTLSLRVLPNCDGSLEDKLKAVEPNWEKVFIQNSSIRTQDDVYGAPVGLLVSPAATSCLSMIRECPRFRKACPIAKLFAKHMKIEDQITLLNGNRVVLAAGTPNRLCKLLEEGALKLNNLRWIVLDVRLDVKQRTLLDMGDVSKDWWGLWERYFRGAVEQGANIALFSGPASESQR